MCLIRFCSTKLSKIFQNVSFNSDDFSFIKSFFVNVDSSTSIASCANYNVTDWLLVSQNSRTSVQESLYFKGLPYESVNKTIKQPSESSTQKLYGNSSQEFGVDRTPGPSARSDPR